MDLGLSHLSPQNHEIQSINTKASLEKKEEKQNTLRFPWNKTLDKTWRETWQRTQSSLQTLKGLTGATQFQSSSPIRFALFPLFYAFNLNVLNVWCIMNGWNLCLECLITWFLKCMPQGLRFLKPYCYPWKKCLWCFTNPFVEFLWGLTWLLQG